MILDLKSAFLFFCFQNKGLLYQKLKGGPKRRKRVYYFLVVFLLFLCGIVSEKSQNWALCTEFNPWWELSQESHFEFLLNLIRWHATYRHVYKFVYKQFYACVHRASTHIYWARGWTMSLPKNQFLTSQRKRRKTDLLSPLPANPQPKLLQYPLQYYNILSDKRF